MAFCGNCGFEVPEGMKFCPNCGTAVLDLNSMNSISECMDNVSDKQIKEKPKRSIPWMIVAIVSLILGIVAWIIPSYVATWIIMSIALAAAIVSLCMKARFRAISIISIVVSGALVFGWLIQGVIYLRSPHNPKEVSIERIKVTIPAEYLAEVNETTDCSTYVTSDDNALVMIVTMDYGFTDGQFNNWSGMINDAVKEALETEMSITGSSASQYREIGNVNCLVFQYSGTLSGENVKCKAILLNDVPSQKSLLIANVYATKVESKYGDDFDEIVNGIQVGGSSASSPNNEKSSSEGNMLSTGGVDPQLKAALDEYEAFVDEYVSFMKRYQADPNNALGMLSDYSSMLARLAEFSEKINGYDTSKMSKADYAYYLDVLNRVEKKMLDVAY